MKYARYPSWGDIKDNISLCDAIEIITCALDCGTIDDAVKDYIKVNFDPIYEDDIDAEYEAWRDIQI